MKTFYFFILVLFLRIDVMAQTPQSLRYQAVARDGAGNVPAGNDVSFRIIFLQGSIRGPTVCSETHSKTTHWGPSPLLQSKCSLPSKEIKTFKNIKN